MRAILFLLISFFFVPPAMAQETLDTPMRAAILTGDELRFLQAALAYEGHYSGLLDGQWGPASQAAFQDSAGNKPADWRHAARMAIRFNKVLETGGWQPQLHGATNIGLLLPMARMQPGQGGSDTRMTTRDGELQVRLVLAPAALTRSIHALIVANSPGLKPDYSLVRDTRIVTSSALNSGQQVYMRSEARGGNFASAAVTWKPDAAAEARLVIASLGTGAQRQIVLQSDGVLNLMVGRLATERDNKVPQTPTETVRPGALAGTAFYINNTDLVTATAVLNRCQAVALADGTVLTRLTDMTRQDLVVMTSPRRSAAWLPLGAPVVPDANDMLWVQRFEDGANRVPGLVERQGPVITALKLDSRAMRLMIGLSGTAAQTGAPVFNANNDVVGVMVAPPQVAQASLLQQMGFAVPAVRLAAALKRNSILFAGVRDSDGAPTPVNMDAIVPVFCR